VVERVDDRVLLFADVAGAGLDELARGRSRGAGRERDAAGLVVDAVGRSRGGRGDDGTVGVGDALALLLARHALDVLVHLAGLAAQGDVSGVVAIEQGCRVDDAQRDLQLVGVDRDGGRGRRVVRVGRDLGVCRRFGHEDFIGRG
jgi:hypothetical protein